jgi:hypothetical protein
MSCHVVSCHVVSCRVVSCHVMSCHVMSCCLLVSPWHTYQVLVAFHVCEVEHVSSCLITGSNLGSIGYKRQDSMRMRYRLFCDGAHYAHHKALHNALSWPLMLGMVVAQGSCWGRKSARTDCSGETRLALHAVSSSRAGKRKHCHCCYYYQAASCPHRICTDPRGRKYAQQVQCARVYHINVVLRIRTSTQDRVSDRAYREKSMQIQRHAFCLPRLCTYKHMLFAGTS